MRLALVLLLGAIGLSCGGPPGGACGPLNCLGCCNTNGYCESGKTDDLRCGKGGQMCGACTGTTTCHLGVCTGGGAGGGNFGGGFGGGAFGGGFGGGAFGGGFGGGAFGGGFGGGGGGLGGGSATGGGTGGGSAGGMGGMGGAAGGMGGMGGMGGGAAGGSGGGTATDGGSPVDGGLTAEQVMILSARPYTTVVPTGYDAGTAVPLVVLLHGYGATGAVQNGYFGFTALANSKTFILATPDGTLDVTGQRFWNATSACCGFGAMVDDVKYLTAIMDEASLKYRINPKRIYFVGHSNGGFMSHRMACDKADRIAAIVSLAGAQHQNAALCNPSVPVSALQVHGTNDTTILYDGGSTFGAGTAYPSAPETVATWAAKNGCNATLATLGAAFDLDTNVVGAEANPAAHSCTAGAAELWTLTGSGHIPGLDAKWGTAVWNWLEAHPKP